MAAGDRTIETKTFVLRLWSEEARIRMTLEDPRTRVRRSFSSFRELSRFAGALFREPRGEGNHDAPPSRRRNAFLAATALLPCLALAAPPASLSLGSAEGRPGSAVTLPVLVRAAEFGPVGALSLRVRVEPASAVESVSFGRAGAWSARRAAFEARPRTEESWSWIVSLAEPSPASGVTQVGEVVVRLSRAAAAGSEVHLRMDPDVSGFGDRDGTRFVSAASLGLVLSDGLVSVVERPSTEPPR